MYNFFLVKLRNLPHTKKTQYMKELFKDFLTPNLSNGIFLKKRRNMELQEGEGGINEVAVVIVAVFDGLSKCIFSYCLK